MNEQSFRNCERNSVTGEGFDEKFDGGGSTKDSAENVNGESGGKLDGKSTKGLIREPTKSSTGGCQRRVRRKGSNETKPVKTDYAYSVVGRPIQPDDPTSPLSKFKSLMLAIYLRQGLFHRVV